MRSSPPLYRPSQGPTETEALEPTDEQAHILDLFRSSDANLNINALAGTGKTSTLELLQLAARTTVLCLAFNVRIAKKMRETFLDTTSVRTFNSLGNGVWGANLGRKSLDLNERKNSDLLREAIFRLPRSVRSEAYDQYFEITSAVALGKSLGYIPDGKFPNGRRLCDWATLSGRLDTQLSELGQELVDEVLVTSIKAAFGGTIDYDDQIYMPAVFGGTFPNFPVVLVDEDQDLNPCNHAMLAKLKRSRIIAVGDDGQSIYAFRGAVPGGVRKLKEMFKMKEADLTVSFRCPENIVRNVHWHRPNFKWNKTGGHVEVLHHPALGRIPDNAAIICRNNAPLFKLAIRLLTLGRGVSVSGTAIGPKIAAIMRKLGDENLLQRRVISAIDHWLENKLSAGSVSAPDIAECMRIFARQSRTLSGAIAYANSLFKEDGNITLTTGHKAKGLEWDVVYHLDPWLIGDDEQERNLRYVISTRSKDQLYEIDSRELNGSGK